MKINVYKRGIEIVNDNHHQNENQNKHTCLSTKIINNENRHVWNENQRGECELSQMNIVKRKLSHSRWNEQDIVGIVKNNCV